MSEHDEQKELFNWKRAMVHLIPELEWLHAIPNGGKRSKFVAIKMKQEGVTPGILDTFLPVAASGYHGFYIEMKYGTGRLRPDQTRFIKFVEHQGYKTDVFYSWVDAARALLKYLPDRMLNESPYRGKMSHTIDPEDYVLLGYNYDLND